MSKLETWGMPITEYKITGKPIVTVDLPYAHETVGDYHNVSFVKQDDIDGLSEQMEKVIKREVLGESSLIKITEPYMRSWSELCRYLLL